MTCDQTQKVSLLIDGELTAAEQSAVERHLLECAECHQAREGFMNLRSELFSYQPALAPADADAALARILSKQDVRVAKIPVAATGRNPFSVLFGFQGFSPRLASAVALLVLALTIGGIVFLRTRSQGDQPSTASTSPAQHEVIPARSNETSSANAPLSDAIAQRRANGSKAGQPTRGNKQLNNRGLKPERDRTAPSPPPRPQIGVPPTYAAVDENLVAPSDLPGRAVGAERLMARHLEQSELLLRSFRNIRAVDGGAAPGIDYERRRARQLLYQNIRLQREADDAGDVGVASLLGALEPILLDIANLRDKPDRNEVRAISDRVERKNLVPLLQVNSTTVARAYD